MRVSRLLPLLTAGLTLFCFAGSAVADTWYSVNDPIDPAYLTEMPFGARSQWIQPWRAYLDTPPATALRDGMGINFNIPDPAQAQVTARLLAESGIRRARYEISWSNVSYANPTVFANAPSIDTVIGAFRDNGIRPLILLNANQGIPGPTKSFTAALTASAPAGATTVQLDDATAAQVVPGYSGLNIGTQAAGVIFTSVNSSDVATLSQPLPNAFAEGAYPASTLLYQPFAQPLLADGSPNPQFEATLAGWLGYVRMTMNLVTSEYGSSNFDVEVWNELGFGSDFLNLGNYYNPLPAATEGNTDQAILAATVGFLHDPANGWANVQVGDGFTDQTTPTDNVSGLPAGLDAIDKHPYIQLMQYPWDTEAGNTIPLNALGAADYTIVAGQITDNFVPTYNAFFPEFYLTGIKTETLIREVAPLTTSPYGYQVGRATAPLGGAAPAMWVTETGMDPTTMNNFPDALTAADYAHIHAKAALRTYVSFIGKGVQAVDLFAVNGAPDWNNVDPGFFTAAKLGTSDTYTYPGAAAGGAVTDATRRLAATLTSAQPISEARPLSLLGIASDSDAYQWAGDGTAAHPDLYDRDLLVFQPFQLTPQSWVAAVYVMTRNIAKVYNEALPPTDPTRTDLPPENFRVTIGGVRAASLTAYATDPLSGQDVPVDVISRDGDKATLQMPVTDSPEMLTLTDARTPAVTPATPVPPVPPSDPTAAGLGAGPHDGPAAKSKPFVGTRASSGQKGTGHKFSASSTLVRLGGAVYLQIECTAACRIRWSVSLPAGEHAVGGRGVQSRQLRSHGVTRIRILAVPSGPGTPRSGGMVSLTVVNPRHNAQISRRLTVKASLLK